MYSHGQNGLNEFGLGLSVKSSLLISGSARKIGSSVTLMCVHTLPFRIQCSIEVTSSLEGMFSRRCHPCLMCVVVTVSMLPFHTPVEKPIQVCGALGDGCGRPSIQIVRFCS